MDGLNQRLRTDYGYNLHLLYELEIDRDFYGMPIVKAEKGHPNDLTGFNNAKTSSDFDKGIHFYLDDYQFERVWNTPERYLDILRRFNYVLTPDFSLYTDMPKPLQIYNVYRSRLLGAWWQRKGVSVITTVSWSDADSYDFCFNGIEKGAVVSISTVGIAKNKEARRLFIDGVNEMIKRIEPKTILVYGKEIAFDSKGAEVVYYRSENRERMSKIGR